MWETAIKYFRNNLIIQDCLTALQEREYYSKNNVYKINNCFSIVNGKGVGLSFYYGYSYLIAELIDESFNNSLDRRSKEWKIIKERGVFELSIEVKHTLYYPPYPPSCLKRLLDILKNEFGGFKIEKQSISLIKTNNPENIVNSYIKLCEILYTLRIKCHNDIKKYLFETGKIPENKLKVNDFVEMYGFKVPYKKKNLF